LGLASSIAGTINRKDSAKKMQEHMAGLKDAAACPPCSAPLQFTMKDSAQQDQPLPLRKNPDVWCTVLSWCGPRLGVAAWVMGMYIPGILASKYCTFGYMVACICWCIVYVVFIAFLKLIGCCKSIKTPSPGLKKVVVKILQYKCEDKAKERQEVAGGKGRPEIMFRRGCDYAKNLIIGIACLQFLRPRVVFTYAKTLFAMIFTEIFMAISIWFYFAARFLTGTATWRLCSFFGWVEELLVCQNIRNRLTFGLYPQFLSGNGKGDGEDKDKPSLPVGCCSGCECGNCGCSACGCDACSIMCSLCGPLCCTLCELSMDILGDVMSALLIFGKAYQYAVRQVREMETEQEGAPNQE
jgi:hypothetical protein